jgi:hypothetical protein
MSPQLLPRLVVMVWGALKDVDVLLVGLDLDVPVSLTSIVRSNSL